MRRNVRTAPHRSDSFVLTEEPMVKMLMAFAMGSFCQSILSVYLPAGSYPQVFARFAEGFVFYSVVYTVRHGSYPHYPLFILQGMWISRAGVHCILPAVMIR